MLCIRQPEKQSPPPQSFGFWGFVLGVSRMKSLLNLKGSLKTITAFSGSISQSTQ
ncbi:hypothetical protein [Kingella sp. (in: b-proteobacteria)]|uniref:hypothetical protein n=1 Tax=Kingella sp. (in: b-proteobacteria) TaxID=2020713 RepID=UPI0026DB30D8|nr:hypothetical protein [Kingella sp. (in: b-proteobacteria)]MDO4657122.1 hypothetical protein [Kingella sp. (in: b-proteobacteria)]